MENKALIESRLEYMEKVYTTVTQFIDELPAIVPEKTRAMIKDSILDDAELKMLLEEMKGQRPPRLFLFGRTGAGKSSLINALCGSYLAEVSDTESCTKETSIFSCMKDGRTLLEVMDSRGIAESADQEAGTREALFRSMTDFAPDAILLVLSCVHRDSIHEDMELAVQLKKAYYDKYLMEVPVLIVLNKADAVPPVREVLPFQYSPAKERSISKICAHCRQIAAEYSLNTQGILAVSSLMEWTDASEQLLTVSDINLLSEEERGALHLDFDGRWNMNLLMDMLEAAMGDPAARSGLRMALRLDEITHSLAKHVVDLFCGAAGTVALTPIPIADLYVLLALQSVMVGIIAVLGGREANMETAKEFILSLGGIGGAGLGFRLLAQQSSKLANAIFPGAGSVISTTVAASGTRAIGNAAIKHYLK